MAQYDYPNLLNAETSDGNGASLPLNRRQMETNAISTLYVFGTFDGATVKIQATIDEVTWFDVPSASYTAQTMSNLTVKAKFLRAVVSGSGAGTSVSSHVH